MGIIKKDTHTLGLAVTPFKAYRGLKDFLNNIL